MTVTVDVSNSFIYFGGPHPVMLRTYSWLSIEESLPGVLGEPVGCLNPVGCVKAGALPPIALAQFSISLKCW